MIINGCIGNSMHLVTFGTIFNWSNRKQAFTGIRLFFLSLIPIVNAAKYTVNSRWTYLVSGILNLTILPYLVHKFYFLDPLDAGFIENEQAGIFRNNCSNDLDEIKVSTSHPLIIKRKVYNVLRSVSEDEVLIEVEPHQQNEVPCVL